jgi:hypothetical protein
MEGSTCDLILDTIPSFTWICQDTRSSGPDLNPRPPEYKASTNTVATLNFIYQLHITIPHQARASWITRSTQRTRCSNVSSATVLMASVITVG